MRAPSLRLDCQTRIPGLPPERPLALPSIAVAGTNAPCSIAPCRRTSPPGSNSPATAARALPAQPLSNASSAAISNVAFSRMALPALDAPSAVTIFSLPARAFVQGRGVCPACNTRRMVETAAHLADHVFPRLPVRQWVLSVPKRLRYHLATGSGDRDAGAAHFPERGGTRLAPGPPACRSRRQHEFDADAARRVRAPGSADPAGVPDGTPPAAATESIAGTAAPSRSSEPAGVRRW